MKKLIAKLAVLLARCSMAVADDKLCGPGQIITGPGLGAALVAAGLGGTNKFKNIYAIVDMPMADGLSGSPASYQVYWAYSRTAPGTDADWEFMPLGSKITVITVSAGASTAATEYMHTAASTWTLLGSVA